MTEAYYVRDYRGMTTKLLAQHPFEKAMALAGGGDTDMVGAVEAGILIEFGLTAGHSVIDIGCGSGRLSSQLSKRLGDDIAYLGTDVVSELLAYARQNATTTYRFDLTGGTSIPAADESTDFVAVFSVFTHLRRAETLAYLREARRTLRNGGLIVFSFLELRHHAKIFALTALARLIGKADIENHSLSRRLISRWADELGFAVETILPPERLGQTVAVLRKRN